MHIMEPYKKTSLSSSSSSTCYSTQILLLAILFLLALAPFITTGGGCDPSAQVREDKSNEEVELYPNAIERGIGIIDFNTRWKGLRAWAKLVWMDLLRPPDSGYGRQCTKAGAGEKMKTASKKSFEATKDAVEKTAAGAAKAVKEKIKKKKAVLEAEL